MQPLKIFRRYHFSSFFKRMTVISGYVPAGTNETKYIVTVKGAPETLESMVCFIQNCLLISLILNTIYIVPSLFWLPRSRGMMLVLFAV